ncbi:hypothetical protein MRB53_038353 [Persea americana]|nr:hypothetical protein MRB53_038353 [Persea americana]
MPRCMIAVGPSPPENRRTEQQSDSPAVAISHSAGSSLLSSRGPGIDPWLLSLVMKACLGRGTMRWWPIACSLLVDLVTYRHLSRKNRSRHLQNAIGRCFFPLTQRANQYDVVLLEYNAFNAEVPSFVPADGVLRKIGMRTIYEPADSNTRSGAADFVNPSITKTSSFDSALSSGSIELRFSLESRTLQRPTNLFVEELLKFFHSSRRSRSRSRA